MTALVSIGPKLSKLIPLLASDKPGEVVATAAAITRTLATAGADWHELTAVLVRAEPPDASAPLTWRDIPSSERAGRLAAMRFSELLTKWERNFSNSILEQVQAWPRRTLSEKQIGILDRLVRRIAEARR